MVSIKLNFLGVRVRITKNLHKIYTFYMIYTCII